MRYSVIALLMLTTAYGQTGGASIAGTVQDSATAKPISGAWVIAKRSGLPPAAKNVASGADGTFQIPGLASGTYTLCVEAQGDQYLDPCQWNGSPTAVTLTAGQTASSVTLKLTAASLLTIQIQDPQNALNQLTTNGRHPGLNLGVWGPMGFYHAHASGGPAPSVAAQGGSVYVYRLAVPLDTALSLYVTSQDLQLGDSAGAALQGNTSQQGFQQATGVSSPVSFSFTVLGMLH